MNASDRRGNCARCDAPDCPERPDVRVYYCNGCWSLFLDRRKPVRQLYSELRAGVPTTYGGQP